MKSPVINAMFGKGRGGIEQSFLDYSKALRSMGYEVISIVRPGSKIRDLLVAEKIPFVEIENKGTWDFLAIFRLRNLIKKNRAELAICHGNRATNLLRKSGNCTVVGVAHNYKIKRFPKLKHAIAVTQDLKKKLEEKGVPEVFHIPNTVNAETAYSKKPFHTPLVIGAMGRLVPEKDFKNFIHALSLLLQRGMDFRVRIAGSGVLEDEIKALVREKNLQDHVEFTGWISDKKQFFDSIDIFCLSSVTESFGIVILEAFSHSTPVVSTDVQGAKEIITSDKDGIIVEKRNPELLAQALAELMENEQKAEELALHGYNNVQQNYDFGVLCQKIDGVIKALTATT